ncbi:enoyl-CoA hydratase/isomerase family protein [Microbacterium lacticum]
MTAEPLRVEQSGSVRWLILNRPERRNALDEQITIALEEQVRLVEGDPTTAVVVIAGEGPSFCAGGDFRHFLAVAENDGVVPFLTRLSAVLERIEGSSKPWVAALHGHAIAGGLEIALVCDVVVAATGTAIADGHVTNRLLPAAGSSVRLERAVGKSTARWMHLSGEPQSAEELYRLGWIHEVVPGADLRDRAQLIAERLAQRHSGTQQNMKRLLTAIDRMDAAAALHRELDAFGENWERSDTEAALRTFLGRRASAQDERT